MEGGTSHALLWHGSADSVVELHPAGFDVSFAFDVSGNEQVGDGVISLQTFVTHALLWHGTAESVVDLHPAGFTSSNARGVSEGTQVGYGETIDGQRHALLWHGTAESVVDLHPSGFADSFAEVISGDSQAGFGNSHALLWHGTAESVVDLNPAGFHESRVRDLAGNRQVGMASIRDPITGDIVTNRAMLWTGTAESAIDLHQYLVGLEIAFSNSGATSIADNGDIVGFAIGGQGPGQYAVLWKLVPEPNSDAIFCCGLLAAACSRRRPHDRNHVVC
jgi:hypothetical protein